MYSLGEITMGIKFGLTNQREGKFRKSLIAMAVIGLTHQTAFAQEAEKVEKDKEEEVEVIEVTGIRGSLASAALLKRESDTFVDSITASDANVLPDLSVAEALARIPGVTVTRFTAGDDDFPSPEGSGNLVRGLGFVRSEFNGRDAFSANGGRALDWAAIPPQLIGGVDVYKNQSADLIEGGIGGTINLRTLEPFDREGRVAIFSLDNTYTDLRKEWSPDFSAVLGDRWETDKGEFGLLGSFSTSELKSDVHGFQTGAPNPREYNGATVAVPQGFQLRTNEVDRERDSYYLAGQWRAPDGNAELTVKYIRVENSVNSVESTVESFIEAGNWNSHILSDLVTTPFTSDGLAQCGAHDPDMICEQLVPVDGGLMEEGMLSNLNDSWMGGHGLQVANLAQGIQEESMTDDISINFKWNPADQWMVELDAHRTTAESKNHRLRIGTATHLEAFYRPDLDDPYLEFSYNPSFGYGNVIEAGNHVGGTNGANGTSDPNNYFIRYADDDYSNGDGDLTALRADITYDFDDAGWFESVQFGARYSEREQVNRNAGGAWAGVTPEWSSVGLMGNFDTPIHEIVDFGDFFRGGVVGGENTHFASIDPSYLRDPNKFFDWYNNEPDFAGGTDWNPNSMWGEERRSTDGKYTPLYPNSSSVSEETLNLYVRFDFYHELSNGMDIEGNVGVRYTRTDSNSDGQLQYSEWAADENNVEEPLYPQSAEDRDHERDFLPETAAYLEQMDSDRTVDVTDDHFLPSFNLKLNLDEDRLIRFGISKAVTRPNISEMNASQNVSAALTRTYFDPLPEDHPDFGIATGAKDISLGSINVNGGNPDLKATEAISWDVSFEWYFDEGDYFSAALFGKDIKNIFAYGTEVRDVVNLDGESVNYQFIGTVNQADADLTGIELSYQAFFQDLPGLFSNLGIQANYTYIDSSATPPAEFLDNDGDGEPDPGSFVNRLRFSPNSMLGQSQHTANLVGIYQDEEFEARLAYNWRSEYMNAYRDWVTGFPLEQDASGFLDASVRYNITDNLTVSFNAANILDTKSKSSVQIDEAGQRYMRSSFLNDRRFKFGIQYAY